MDYLLYYDVLIRETTEENGLTGVWRIDSSSMSGETDYFESDSRSQSRVDVVVEITDASYEVDIEIELKFSGSDPVYEDDNSYFSRNNLSDAGNLIAKSNLVYWDTILDFEYPAYKRESNAVDDEGKSPLGIAIDKNIIAFLCGTTEELDKYTYRKVE